MFTSDKGIVGSRKRLVTLFENISPMVLPVEIKRNRKRNFGYLWPVHSSHEKQLLRVINKANKIATTMVIKRHFVHFAVFIIIVIF